MWSHQKTTLCCDRRVLLWHTSTKSSFQWPFDHHSKAISYNRWHISKKREAKGWKGGIHFLLLFTFSSQNEVTCHSVFLASTVRTGRSSATLDLALIQLWSRRFPSISACYRSPAPLCARVCVCVRLSHWVRLSATRWTRRWNKPLPGWSCQLCHWTICSRGPWFLSCAFLVLFPPSSFIFTYSPVQLLCFIIGAVIYLTCLWNLNHTIWQIPYPSHFLAHVHRFDLKTKLIVWFVPLYLAVLSLLWKRVQVPQGELRDRIRPPSPWG